jgi:hypothetical protein
VEALTHMHTLNQRLNQSHSGDKTKQTTPSALSLSNTLDRSKSIRRRPEKRRQRPDVESAAKCKKRRSQMAKSHTQLRETRPAILELIGANKAKQTCIKEKTVNFGRQKFIFRSY